MALPPQTRLGNYEIRSLVSVGGMGEVYLADDLALHRSIAIKVLPADFALNADRLHRFEREAQAISRLNHPNIITIHQIGTDGAVQFMATEFVDGESLRQRIDRGPLSIREALDIAAQVASALAAAHEAGIVHRDIKPENIMLRRDGLVKVLDFGLAKWSEPKRDTAPDQRTVTAAPTIPGVVMGTARYMSPEQARGFEVDGRTDVFSLGVVVYELLSGHAPFDGPTASDVIAAILMTDPPPLVKAAPGSPPGVQAVVFKALRKDRAERYGSIKLLELDLRAVRQQLEFDHGRRTTLTGAMPAVSSSEGANSDGVRRTRPIARIAIVIALVSALVAAALIAGVVAAYFRLAKPAP